MKVKLRSVLKTSSSEFECFEEGSFVYPAGNTLCIKKIDRNDCEFVTLSKDCHSLMAYKPYSNFRALFCAEKHEKGIEIASYSLKSERKAVSLLENSAFLASIESIELIADTMTPAVVFGYAKSKLDSTCLFAVDFNKGKMIGVGFTSSFQEAIVHPYEPLTISVCGNSNGLPFIKSFHCGSGQWESDEKTYKKLFNMEINRHEWLSAEKMLFANKTHLFVMEGNEVVQKIYVVEDITRRITHVLRIPKGVVVASTNNKVDLFGESNVDGLLERLGEIRLQTELEGKIYHMKYNQAGEDLWIKTDRNQVLVWKCDQILTKNQSSNWCFTRVQNARTKESEGTISLASAKKYCMMSGGYKNVTLWNIENTQCMLRTTFDGGASKIVHSCAISPDGDCFVAGFEEKLRVYKILLTKFKLYIEFPFKRCHGITFSHGGHLVACTYGRNANSSIVIINMLRKVDISTIKLQCEPTQIQWNQLDDELIIAADNNTVHIYKVSDNTRLHYLKFNAPITHVRLDYATNTLMVSSEEGYHIVDRGVITEFIKPPIKNFSYVFPLNNQYLAVSHDGVLSWSSSSRFENVNSIPLFQQSSFKLFYRNGFLVASSTFQEVLVLQCDFGRERSKLGETEDIVQIQKQEIISFFEAVKNLQSNFELLRQGTQIKIQEDRKAFESRIALQANKFEQEIAFSQKKFAQMATEKMKQEKECEQVFDSVDRGQSKHVSDIEKMYDRKLRLEKQKLMTLQQAHLEQKMKYERVIMELEAKYHKDVVAIRETYTKKVEEESAKLEQVKLNNLQLKKRMEMKLIDADEENELALYGLQSKKDDVIQCLKIKSFAQQEDLERAEVSISNQKAEFIAMKQSKEEQDGTLARLNHKLAEAFTRVHLLEKEMITKNAMIEERNQIIEQEQHKIKDLEKAKYVLSFRTTEIRKELQPKESLIDKLKSELLKLDEEFKGKQKSHFQLCQKVEKLQKICEVAKKEGAELKLQIKNKEKLYDDLCSEIFVIVNQIEPKEWNTHLVRLYQAHVKEDKFRTRHASKKQDQTSQEINRHLIHVEQSLMHVSTGNDKILKGREKDVVRKMKQNSELVYDLNIMRKNQNEYLHEIQQKTNQITRLKREIAEFKRELNEVKKELTVTNRNSTRSQTAKTSVTKRGGPSRQLFSRDRSHVEGNQLQMQRITEDQLKEFHKERSRIGSAHKTLMWRDDMRGKSNKLFDLARELESARLTIKRQDRMIEELNHRLLGAVDSSVP